MKFGLLLTSALMFACSSTKESTDTSAEASSEETGCGVTIDETHPASGAVDFYYRDSIDFELSDEDTTATLALKDASGADVEGSFVMDDDMLMFTPSVALSPSTSYTAVLNYCGDTEPVNVDFTTSALGTALANGDDSLVGNTYAVDLGSGNFVEPPGVGDLIGGLLENQILIGITDASDGQMSIRGAISEEGSSNQDFCTETLESFPAADFSGSPYFEIPEGDVQLSVAGLDIMINSMSLSGTFAADGSVMGGASVRGELDARDIGPLLEGTIDSTDPSEICSLLMGFGVQCIECSSDSQPYCISLYVNRLTAENTNETLGLVCEGECHESCGENTCDTPQTSDVQECTE